MILEILPEEVFEEKEEEKSFYNIAVTVIEANQVAWQNMETRVCVQLGKEKKLTRIKESSERPYYNEYFVFDFEGSLESLMDKIMVISIVHPRHRLRRPKTLGSARLDLGTIWIQPGHEIRDKWILLTDPSDPTGRVKGYISCEVGIIPPGGKLSAKIKTVPVKELFIPESQGAGRLKARYMFRVHRGEHFSLKATDKKFSSFVRIYFAGLSGQTTHRKYSHYPLWNEEIVFTELFPPLYNRVRFDVHLGKSIVYTKYLNLSDMSDPAVKGFLPMYGPSFIYLYSPPYHYMGSLLVSLETKTVLAFSEHEKLLAVKRQKCPELLEKLFWNTADFVVFGIVYEVSMLDKSTRRRGPLLLRLGFADSESRELTDDNLFESWEDEVHVQDKNYSCLPRTRVKQTLYTRKELPDIRGRPYLSNRLAKAASSFGRELLKTQFLLDNRPELGTPRLWAALKNLKQQCHILKTGFAVGPTPLDKERFKTVIAKINSLILSINQIPPSESLIVRFEKAVKIYKEMLKLVQDPQETLPLIILQLASHHRVLAYVRIRPRDILYSSKESEKGINCGSVQTLFLKSSSKKGGFGGKLDILLWLGPFQSVGLGLAGVPTGFQDMSTLSVFPRAIIYSEGAVFTCRAHIYQGQFVPCEDAEGSCSLSVKVFFGARNVESTIKKALCPIWSETLTIQSVTIYGSAEDNKKHPRKIVIEVWNHSGDNRLVGRVVARPHVFLTTDRLQPPDYPPPLEWIRIHSAGRIKGELLAMFELLQEREQRIFVEDEVEPEVRDDLMKTPVGIPDYIKPSTVKYRLEVLFWGVRGTKDFRLSSVNNPRVVMDCGPTQISSLVLRQASSFPNFVQTPLSVDINLPADWSFAPPLIVRMFDSRSFGTKAFIGSHTFRSLRQFVVNLPRKEDWMRMRSGQKVDVVDTFQYDDEEYKRRKSLSLSQYVTSDTEDLESEPLVELKQEIPPKPPALIWPTRKLFKSFFGVKRKAKSENLISLALLPPGFDPESDENFFDWWTKYYESLNRHIEQETNSPEDKLKNHKKKKKTPGIHIYASELENQPEFEGFQDVLKNITIFHEPIMEEKRKTAVFKGGVSLYRLPVEDFITTGGWSAEHGVYSSVMTEAEAIVHILIRVYVIRAYRLHTKDRFGTVDPFIEVSIPSETVSDVKNYIRQESNPIFGKCYELQARLPYDSILRIRVMDHDRFSSAELVGETSIDIENRYYSRHRGTCGLQRSYDIEGYNRWRDAYKPSETLEWLCLSYNFPPPIYTSTSVTVTTRKFGCKRGPSQDAEHRKECLALSALLHWDKIPLVGCKLVEEHVETRSLYNSEQPGIEQGKLEMWVDLLPRQTLDLPPQVVVEPRRPDKYQLRAIVWSTHKVILVDRGIMVGKRHTDIYVKGWLKGHEDLQQTDVHYASLTGEGLFNWRFVFDFSYLREENMIVLDDNKDPDLRSNKIPPVLYFQLWDLERFKKDDFLGAISLKLHNIPPPSQKVPWSQKYVPLKGWTLDLFKVRKVRGAWPFTGSRQGKPPKTVGMLDLELTLMTAEEAERTPAGRGRSEPSALPEPIRPMVKYTMWIAPFRAIKNYLCRYHKKHMCQCAFIVFFAIFIVIFIYSFPNYTVKKILGA